MRLSPPGSTGPPHTEGERAPAEAYMLSRPTVTATVDALRAAARSRPGPGEELPAALDGRLDGVSAVV